MALRRILQKLLLIVAMAMVASGCESLDRRELVWQGLHAVDVAQTLNAAGDPCYKETAWLTAKIIGEQPSDAEVLAWGVGTAVVHMLIANELERRDAPRWLQATWSIGTIVSTGYTVVDNHRNGVRPWGDNLDHDACLVR
jgi:hypothetical protein